jgi:large subunit ribosomal protein L4e
VSTKVKRVKIFNLIGESVGKISLPLIFNTPLRPDIIKKAVLSLQSHRFQAQGRNQFAGKRTTAEGRGVGLGIARIPRIKGTNRGALAPGTVGGRQGHPPVSSKQIVKRISKKEKRLALYSSIAATARSDLVSQRGHSIEDVVQIPLIVTDEIASLKKTKEVEKTFLHLGVLLDIYRVRESQNIRAGRGKLRGRKRKQAIGPLIVLREDKGLLQAARNLPGVDVANVDALNSEMLAPGTHPGRLTIWTKNSVNRLAQYRGAVHL